MVSGCTIQYYLLAAVPFPPTHRPSQALYLCCDDRGAHTRYALRRQNRIRKRKGKGKEKKKKFRAMRGRREETDAYRTIQRPIAAFPRVFCGGFCRSTTRQGVVSCQGSPVPSKKGKLKTSEETENKNNNWMGRLLSDHPTTTSEDRTVNRGCIT